jgi:hypothetical protein
MQNQDQDISINILNMEIKAIKDKLTEMPTRSEMRLYMKELVDETLKNCDRKYATIDRLTMLEKIVYGAVGAILLAFTGAVIALVIK